MKTREQGIKQESEVFFATPGMRARSLFYYVTCAGHFYYEDSYHLERESYNSLLIMYVLNGRGRVRCYDRTVSVEKDDVVLLNCYDWHSYSAEEDLETMWVHFDGQSSQEVFKCLYEKQGCVMNVKDAYTVRRNLQRIYDMHAAGGLVNEALQSAWLSRILAEFFSWEESGEGQDPCMVEESIQFIRENLAQEICVRDVAEQVSLSEFYFSRCFKKETGFTPYEYLTNMRVNRAKNLLKNTEKSQYEVAVECGFSNEGNFIRTFKKHTGQTPGTFRRMAL